MQLTNTVVQFTVTIPRFEVDKDNGLEFERQLLFIVAAYQISHLHITLLTPNAEIVSKIIDCPSYPALITDPPIV